MSKRRQTVTSEQVTVTYDPNLCMHAAECIRRLPAVFDPSVARWIRPDRASAEEVVSAVARCPTGALQATRADGATEPPDQPATVQVTARGPLHVRGAVSVVDHAGQVVASGPRLALCRCGESRNKPFCDGSHRAAGFSDPGLPLGSSEKT